MDRETNETLIDSTVVDSLSVPDDYMDALQDSDEYVRAKAARELQQIGHPYALQACLQTIKDGFDPLHGNYTESVRTLIVIGEPALPFLFDSMLSADAEVRLYSATAVEEITATLFGLEKGKEDPDEQEIFIQWWKAIDYSWEASDLEREVSVTKLKTWYKER